MRREVIGLQVALLGTEGLEENPEVRHLTGGGPSFPPFSSMGLWTLLSLCFLLNGGREGSEGLRIGRKGLIGFPTATSLLCVLAY